MNKALLAKWFWRLKTENGLWQEVFINKYYMKNKCISGVKPKVGDSHFWSSILKVKDLFYQHCRKKLGMKKILGFGTIGGCMINP